MVHGLEKVSAGDAGSRFREIKVKSVQWPMLHTVGSLHNVMTDIRRAADQTAASSEQLSASTKYFDRGPNSGHG